MEMNNSFDVNNPIAETWTVLTDVERIAPCLPGARLTGMSGSDFQGLVKVKVGPITAQYKGTAKFVERDDDAYRAVISARGRDTRGAGNASATITAQLEPVDADVTRVHVKTKLSITGKVAQFGRGVMPDVSAKLMSQFADNLSELIAASRDADTDSETEEDDDEEDAVADAASGAKTGGVEAVADDAETDDVEAVDVLSLARSVNTKTKVTVTLAMLGVVAVLVAAIVVLLLAIF